MVTRHWEKPIKATFRMTINKQEKSLVITKALDQYFQMTIDFFQFFQLSQL